MAEEDIDTSKIGRFGRRAVEKGLVTRAQLQEALRIQLDYESAGRDVPKLGTILLAKNYLTTSQVQDILSEQKEDSYNASTKKVSSLIKEYNTGDIIFKEGDKNSLDLYLIHEGTIELSMRSVQLLERCGAGAFFGITGCLLRIPRTTTAIAKTPCKVFQIPSDKASTFFKTKPEMAIKLCTVLAESLYSMKSKYVDKVLYEPEALQQEALDVLPLTKKRGGEGDHASLVPTKEQVEEDMNKNVGMQNPVNIYSRTGISTTADTAVISDEDLPVIDSSEEHELEQTQEAANVPDLESDVDVGFEEDQKEISDDAANDVEPELSEFQEEEDEEASEESSEDDELTSDLDVEEEDYVLLTHDEDHQAPSPTSQLLPSDDLEGALAVISELESPQFSAEIIKAVSDRIAIFLKIEELELQRCKIEEEQEVLDDIVKRELGRQRREVVKIPPAEALSSSLEAIITRLNPPEPEPDEEGNIPPLPEPPPPLLARAYEIAIAQKKLLIKRDESTLDTLKICSMYSVGEPLYRVLSDLEIGSDLLFGWGVYAMGLKEYREAQTPKIKELRAKINELNESKKAKSGFLGLRKKKGEALDAEIAELEKEERQRKNIMINVNRELNNIEKPMVGEFWRIYELAMQQLVVGLEGANEILIRAFLRWGMLGYSPRWIEFEKCKQILTECAQKSEEPVFNMTATHVYFADELVEFIAKGLLAPSPNEDLELNHRNSPEWKADRAWRRQINFRMQEGILSDALINLQQEVHEAREEQEKLEEALAGMELSKSKTKEHKERLNETKHSLQTCKVRCARKERLAEKVEYEMLTRNSEEQEMSAKSLIESGISFSPEQLAAHEIKCMRRNARLVAKLKEPFLPFTLRDRFKPENKCTNDKESIIASLDDIETRDPLIFKEQLVPGAKRIHRVLLRIPPVIVIAPASGILGFMMNPRAGHECGRIVLPGYFERANQCEGILWNVLSDFRYDTSKASAGVDVMNSDTLVAAYSEVRWNLRKRDKEVRQKSAIYMEENERTNWRRHYAIYMKSAFDSGKQLFYKCPELYELIINKFVDLPEGCEMLKR